METNATETGQPGLTYLDDLEDPGPAAWAGPTEPEQDMKEEEPEELETSGPSRLSTAQPITSSEVAENGFWVGVAEDRNKRFRRTMEVYFEH